MKLVVGLGNPGRQYVGTRHNIGYEVVDALAIKLGWVSSVDAFNRLARTKFEALTLDGTAPSGEKLLMMMPMTFMNCSGRSVQAARVEVGRRLAAEHPAEADLVIPVPESGTPAAIRPRFVRAGRSDPARARPARLTTSRPGSGIPQVEVSISPSHAAGPSRW